MPAPLDLGGEAYREHVKALARERKRQQRSRDALRDGHVTQPQRTASPVTPPQTPPVLSPLSTRELERRLEPFAGRGYRPDPGFLSRLAAAYPGVDLELEVAAALDWLEEPRNAKRRCSKGFLKNWCAKADQDRKAREAVPAPAASPKGVVVNGTWHPPAAFQRNPGPPPDQAVPLTEPLQTFTREELARLRAEHARVPFKDKLAAKAALATNGVHK